MKQQWSRLTRAVLLLCLFGIGTLAWSLWPKTRAVFYSVYRERGKVTALARLSGYQVRTSPHFELYYSEEDADVVDLVLQVAESVYEPVVRKTGLHVPGLVPLILYPSREEMRREFGWGKSESAMGVYWAGTIRILSPNVWRQDYTAKERERIFRRLNPIAHELTHYLFDYHTNGNYPRWFTEGLAQRVEYQVSGYLWLEASSSLKQPLYSKDDLDRRFDRLQNQPLAYRQSYLLVEYIARKFGQRALDEVVALLAKGVPFNNAMALSTGLSLDALFARFEVWVREHRTSLDSLD